uniref:PID domain-containing protein n=1 Tax=Caenorhabditis tropicalis TaxID=1561998 RepID=A0A1I7TD41_9PELO
MTPRSDYRNPLSGYGNGGRGDALDDATPSYYVEHLATFAVGRQFGLTFPADGIRKLKQMEKNSAIWAQPLILRFRHHAVTVEDDNGELVEQFPLELIEQPTAHVSNDSRETYNNVLLFVVREDRKRMSTPTEMHIFQVREDLRLLKLDGKLHPCICHRCSRRPKELRARTVPSCAQWSTNRRADSSGSTTA